MVSTIPLFEKSLVFYHFKYTRYFICVRVYVYTVHSVQCSVTVSSSSSLSALPIRSYPLQPSSPNQTFQKLTQLINGKLSILLMCGGVQLASTSSLRYCTGHYLSWKLIGNSDSLNLTSSGKKRLIVEMCKITASAL